MILLKNIKLWDYCPIKIGIPVKHKFVSNLSKNTEVCYLKKKDWMWNILLAIVCQTICWFLWFQIQIHVSFAKHLDGFNGF
jgi:hypothetical protein